MVDAADPLLNRYVQKQAKISPDIGGAHGNWYQLQKASNFFHALSYANLDDGASAPHIKLMDCLHKSPMVPAGLGLGMGLPPPPDATERTVKPANGRVHLPVN